MASTSLARRGGAATAALARLPASPAARGARSFMSVNEAGQRVRDGLPPAQGLYDPSLEKDSCGVGACSRRHDNNARARARACARAWSGAASERAMISRATANAAAAGQSCDRHLNAQRRQPTTLMRAHHHPPAHPPLSAASVRRRRRRRIHSRARRRRLRRRH